jgi:DNA-binding NtrC family response regulator
MDQGSNHLPTSRTPPTSELVGQAPGFVRALALLHRMAACDATVLIQGETGTGKELAARAIHYLGARRDRPFIPINCGAIPDLLVESELFGHVRGAFTDARDAQTGLVGQADGGTLFLDEVDALSLKAQVVLLRFLQDGSYRQLGGRTALTAHARVVAATNADLPALVRQGAFREDLYYRLAIVPIAMPALRDRPGDATLLAERFLTRLMGEQRSGPRRFDAASLRWLEQHPWPGNVRELNNFLQREYLLCESDCLRLSAASLGLHGDAPAAGRPTTLRSARQAAVAAFERLFLRQALHDCGGNVSLAARRSGTERRTFGRLLQKHGIDRREFVRG